MAGGVLGHVFANAVEIGSATAHEAFPFAANQGENFKRFVGRLNAWVHQNLPSQRNVTCFSEKSEGEPGRQAEAVFAIAAAVVEFQLQVRASFTFWSEKGKVRHS